MGIQFDFADFLLVPLTPVHVGGGEEAILSNMDYRLHDQLLERIDLRQLMLRQQSDTLLSHLNKDFQGTLCRLREQAAPSDVTERIQLSPASWKELRKAYNSSPSKPHRSGQVELFQRTGNRILLPGSSVKGALRTAWLAWCSSDIDPQAIPADRTDKRASLLAAKAFDLAEGKFATDTDPLRDLSVEDSYLPEDATIVSFVKSWKRSGKGNGYGFQKGPQVHWERMRAVVDGGQPALTRIRIGLRSGNVRDHYRKAGRRNAYPRTPPENIAVLLRALEAHHSPIWQWELEKFFHDRNERLKSALGLFAHLQRSGDEPDAALIRIGRAGHAESKSVEKFREVQRPNIPGKGKTAKEGDARHVLDLSGQPVPFGWALLVRADRWRQPEGWLSEIANASAPANAAEASASPLASQLLYRKGQKVLLTTGETAVLEEDVGHKSSKVSVNIDGDTEPINVEEIKGPA